MRKFCERLLCSIQVYNQRVTSYEWNRMVNPKNTPWMWIGNRINYYTEMFVFISIVGPDLTGTFDLFEIPAKYLCEITCHY